MKRLLSFGIILALLFCAVILPAHGEGEVQQSKAWQGGTAKGFFAGTGTNYDPYLIRTPEELAYFAARVNGGDNFLGKFILLCNDIALNDDSISYTEGTNLVQMKDENGSISFDIFDPETELASQAQFIRKTLEAYTGTLHEWQPIGKDEKTPFKGHFSGGGHTISGLVAIGSENKYQGLFGCGSGRIVDLKIENSLLVGDHFVGTAAGQMYQAVNVQSGAILLCVENAGGIIGGGSALFCQNKGCVFGKTAGGIAAEGNVSYSFNDGYIGSQHAAGIVSSGNALYCENRGSVAGYDMAGGIVYRGGAEHCHNSGNVTGVRYVGGIASSANSASEITLRHCHNSGNVTGVRYVGGIIGQGVVEYCTNGGTVFTTHTESESAQYTGGICGLGHASYCANTGLVESDGSSVGGIVGKGRIIGEYSSRIILNCFNSGKVTVRSFGIMAGGIAGESDVQIRFCYNLGDISVDSSLAGGICGDLKNNKIYGCYNVGNIIASHYVGAIAGKRNMILNLENCYYLTGSAKDKNGTNQNAAGNENIGKTTLDNENVSKLDLLQMANQENYTLNFGDTWKMGKGDYPYPTLIDLHHKEHSFTLDETEFIPMENTCQGVIIRYRFCDCGMAGVPTVTQSTPEHSAAHMRYFANDHYHYHLCATCGVEMESMAHTLGDGIVKHDTAQHSCSVCGHIVSFPVEYHHIPIYLIALFVAVGITAGGLSVYGAWVFRDFRKAKKRSTIKK